LALLSAHDALCAVDRLCAASFAVFAVLLLWPLVLYLLCERSGCALSWSAFSLGTGRRSVGRRSSGAPWRSLLACVVVAEVAVNRKYLLQTPFLGRRHHVGVVDAFRTTAPLQRGGIHPFVVGPGRPEPLVRIGALAGASIARSRHGAAGWLFREPG
jgi:hypothetical protein